MNKREIWLHAVRLRTLPLSLSGIITGSALAWRMNIFDPAIFVPALFTTLFLQILSNLANDYGDAMKGTDHADRVGPRRMVQSGALSHLEIKRGIVLVGSLAFLSGCTLLYSAFSLAQLKYVLVFLAIGLLAIWAAIQYTMGKRAYGYRGLGDVFVLIFFGFVAVSGTYFMFAKMISWPALIQSLTIGSLATGVLHLNNMRDRVEVEKSGKITVAVLLGQATAKVYFTALILMAMASSLFTLIKTDLHLSDYMICLAFIPWITVLIRVVKITEAKDYNNLLKPLAISTFIYSILLFISYLV